MAHWTRLFGTLTRAALLVAAVWAASPPAPVHAQAPNPEGADGVEGDPFKCWWRADKTAVHVGERFTVVLTCAAVEFGRITAVPDLAPIEATAVKLTPFEVVSGTAPADIRERPWRYIQRVYTLRLLGEGFFGRDVDVPSIAVSYAVHAEGPGGGTAGRTQAYVLPPVPIRVLSLAPMKASDIHDAADDTFGAAEARRRRAANELVAAGILLAFAAVLLVAAATRAFRARLERRTTRAVPHVSSRRLLAGCVRGIDRLKTEAGNEGWTVERVSHVLPFLRIAAAVALNRPVSQALEDDPHVAAREGQVALRTGLWRGHRVMVSAPTTPTTVSMRAAGVSDLAGGRQGAALDVLGDAIKVFATARYGREQKPDPTALDAAIDASASAIRQLRPPRPRTRPARPVAAGASGMGMRS